MAGPEQGAQGRDPEFQTVLAFRPDQEWVREDDDISVRLARSLFWRDSKSPKAQNQSYTDTND